MEEPSAMGMAQEAIQLFRSHEKTDNLQFAHMAGKQEEIKILIAEVVKEMRSGFKSYDAKFWGLAILTITLLGGGLITLLLKAKF